MSDLLTADELAARWRCEPESVTAAIRRGELRASKIAGRWLVTEDDVAAYMQARANVAPTKKRTRRPRGRSAA